MFGAANYPCWRVIFARPNVSEGGYGLKRERSYVLQSVRTASVPLKEPFDVNHTFFLYESSLLNILAQIF